MQFFIGDVGVDLSGGDVSVTEHGLNRADIGTVLEQVGRETVAKGVGRELFGNTSFGRVVLHDPFD